MSRFAELSHKSKKNTQYNSSPRIVSLGCLWCISTHRYYVYGVPDCFSGFFSRSETGMRMWLCRGLSQAWRLSATKDVEKSNSKIKNGKTVHVVRRIVKFRIRGYPGPSKDPNKEVRLMRGKIFYLAEKYECSVQLYIVCNYDFKTISVKKMEPNFVRMKVSDLKKYLQSVLRISVTKTCGFVCKSSQACHY